MLPFKFLHCYSLRRFLWPVGFVVNSYPYTALCLHWGNVPDDFSGKQEVCDGPGATSAPTAAQQDAELLQQSQTWNHSMPSSSIPCNEDGHYKSSHWVTCQPCRPFSWSICGGVQHRGVLAAGTDVSVGLHAVLSGPASPSCSRCVDLSISSGFAG